jgi:hypothetical protein
VAARGARAAGGPRSDEPLLLEADGFRLDLSLSVIPNCADQARLGRRKVIPRINLASDLIVLRIFVAEGGQSDRNTESRRNRRFHQTSWRDRRHFFKSSPRRDFCSQEEKQSFREMSLGRYIVKHRDSFFVALDDARCVGYLAGCLENPTKLTHFNDVIASFLDMSDQRH